MKKSKRKAKQAKRRSEKRVAQREALIGAHSPAEKLLERISRERRARHRPDA